MNPYADGARRRLRGLQPQLRPARRLRARARAGARASPSRGSAADGTTWTFKMPRGHASGRTATPATSEDARWTFQIALDAHQQPRRATSVLGYIDPYLADAGVTAVTAPDPTRRWSSTTDRRRTTRSCTTYIPILPKHIWETRRSRSATPTSSTRRSSGPAPYQAVEWKTGQFVRFVRNPNYWGSPRAPPTRSSSSSSRARTRWPQALKTGEIDYARNVNARPVRSLKTGTADIVTVGAAPPNGFTELGFNTYGTDRQRIEGGGASTTALRTPPFRDALGYAIDKDAARRPRPRRATATSARTDDPAGHGRSWHVRAGRRRGRSTSSSPSRSSRPPATCSMPPARASTRRASRSTCDLVHARLGRHLPDGRRVHHRLVGRARDQRHARRSSTRTR